MAEKRYLTKSRFKLACECETKLFYTRKKEYADQSTEDPFLAELAKGGFQVGELAKYYFTDNASGITVGEKGYESSLAETKTRITRGDTCIAEAAVVFDKLFIRVDILTIDTQNKQIRFYEVKSKSWSSDTEFIKTISKGEKKGQRVLDTKWEPYLFDAAFQKYVIVNAYPDYSVNAFLILVNKDAAASVDGLNQFFKVKGEGKIHEVINDPELTRAKLGDEVLITIPVDQECDFIWNNKIDSAVFPGYLFHDYINELAKAYENDLKLKKPVSSVCKSCQFYTKPCDPETIKSGLKECWIEKLEITESKFEKPKVIELWGGKAGAVSIVQKLIDKGKYFLEEVDRLDLSGDIDDEPSGELSPSQRRWEQIRKVKLNEKNYYLDKEGLSTEMGKWTWPLHFIDFETASPALPFTKGSHPYEGIAFQYSHHIVRSPDEGKTYTVEHKNQFLNTDRGVNPNISFIRELKNDLSEDNGTIFRYHMHENTYLRKIHSQLAETHVEGLPDRADLLRFIDSITQYKVEKKEVEGVRNMVDLYELVVKFYYSPYAGGSNSLKKILPAAIRDSKLLNERYSLPVCGKGKPVTSLNFDSKIWIDATFKNDPYKTLPIVFEGFTREELDESFSEFSEVADGGAAMMAYAKLQFYNTPHSQREAIRNSLLKYCELDTLAMVMLWEFWNEEVRNINRR